MPETKACSLQALGNLAPFPLRFPVPLSPGAPAEILLSTEFCSLSRAAQKGHKDLENGSFFDTAILLRPPWLNKQLTKLEFTVFPPQGENTASWS